MASHGAAETTAPNPLTIGGNLMPMRRSVVRSVMPQVCIERSPMGELPDGRIAVIAQFSLQPRISRSLNTMISELLDAGYRIVVSSSCQSPSELIFDDSVRDRVTVLRKPNLGYDFGSWSCGLAWDGDITRAEHVLFLNDSLIGPFSTLGKILHGFEESSSDVYGLTDTTQFGYHLQSYLLGFKNGVLRDPVLRHFWMNIRQESSKQRIIQRNEIGFSRLLRREGYIIEAAFPYWLSVAEGENPTILGWQKLLDLGYPFVKREIVRSPELAPNGEHVADAIRRRFDEDIKEWL